MASNQFDEATFPVLLEDALPIPDFSSELKPVTIVPGAASLPSIPTQLTAAVDFFKEPAPKIISTTGLPQWPFDSSRATELPLIPLFESESYSPSSGPTFSSAGTVYSGAGSRTPPTNGACLPSALGGEGRFRCSYPGCTALLFSTQYLLNKHAKIHASSKPHFCPVDGCVRGPDGRGFERKRELIRHGLVHESPGYICPFCPDQPQKYPRPDNLQRHVRVHHVDKDRNDPLLTEVLARGPARLDSGRRRRPSASESGNAREKLHRPFTSSQYVNDHINTSQTWPSPTPIIEASQTEAAGQSVFEAVTSPGHESYDLITLRETSGFAEDRIQVDEQSISRQAPAVGYNRNYYDETDSDSDFSDSGYLQSLLYLCEGQDQLSILHIDCDDQVSWNSSGPVNYGLMYADQLVTSGFPWSAHEYITASDRHFSKKARRCAKYSDRKPLYETGHVYGCIDLNVPDLRPVPDASVVGKGSTQASSVKPDSGDNPNPWRGSAILPERECSSFQNLKHGTEVLFCRPSCLSTSAEVCKSSNADGARKTDEEGGGCTLCGRSTWRMQTGHISATEQGFTTLRSTVEGDRCRQIETSSDLSPDSGKSSRDAQSPIRAQSDQAPPQKRAESVRQTSPVLETILLESSEAGLDSPSPGRPFSMRLPDLKEALSSLSTDIMSPIKISLPFWYENCWSPLQSSYQTIATSSEDISKGYSSRTRCDSRSVDLLSDGERSFVDSSQSDELMNDWEKSLDPMVRLLRSELIASLIATYMRTEIEEEATHDSDTSLTPGRDDIETSCKEAAAGTGRKGCGSGSGSSSSSAASGCAQSNASTRDKTASSATSTGKHSRAQDDSSADFEDDPQGPRRKKRRVTTTSISSDGRLLACPYCKHDPTRYSDRNLTEKNYRGCSSIYLSTISRLKQHLYRVHKRPDHYCLSCFRIFTSQSSLSAHNRARPSCELHPPLFEEKMTPEQVTSIKRRTVGKSLSDAWFGIFVVLFPDSALPESPFVDSVSSKAIQNFVDHFYRQARARLASLIQSQLEGHMLLESDQQRILDTALEESIAQLVWRTSPQAEDGIGQESPEAPISEFQDNPCEDARSHGLHQTKASLPQSSPVASSSTRNDPDVGQVFGQSWCPDLQPPPGIAPFDEPVVDWSVAELETSVRSENDDARCLQITRDEIGRTSRPSTPQLTHGSPGIINTDDWAQVDSSIPVLETFDWYMAALEHDHDPNSMPHQCEETPKGLAGRSG